MDPLWAGVAGSLVTLLGGVAFLWRQARRGGHAASAPPPAAIAEMGYGDDRWQREVALWRGILRRLEIQARHQTSPSERLLADIAEARERIAEAERHLTN